MAIRKFVIAAVVLAACSERPKPAIVADDVGTQPQPGLARLDSVTSDSVGPAPDESQAVRIEEAPRRTSSAAGTVRPVTGSKAGRRADPQPNASDRSGVPAPTADVTPAIDTALPDSTQTHSSPTTTASPEPDPPATPRTEPIKTAAPPASAPSPRADDRTARAGVVPAGTEIHAALVDSLHSRRDSVGTVVTARVLQNVTDGIGSVFIPADALIQLTVTRLEPAESRSAADGRLELRVDGVRIGDDLRVIDAELGGVPHELKGRGVTGSEAGKVAAGTAAGAVAGRVIGGDTRGAVIGGAVGAAAGAAVAAQTADRDIVVKPRTPIVMVLRTPLMAIDSR